MTEPARLEVLGWGDRRTEGDGVDFGPGQQAQGITAGDDLAVDRRA